MIYDLVPVLHCPLPAVLQQHVSELIRADLSCELTLRENCSPSIVYNPLRLLLNDL
jgi:hypothetical protein